MYKVPLGDWAKNPILKEAGKLNKAQIMAGMEGYALYLLTRFETPTSWSVEEVQVYLSKVRKELQSDGFHTYFVYRRVRGQKPFDT